MTVKFEKVQGKAVVEVKHKSGASSTEYLVPCELVSSEPLANVGFSATHTKNLGNYESVKVGVSLHLPCGTSDKELDDAFSRVTEWVDGKMAAILSEMGE